jgi:L-lactate utilization protein LutB
MPDPNNTGAENVNEQIIDAIKQVNAFLKESDFSLDSISNQLAVQVAGLAMINIVNQQQQLYTLQNAVTATAAKAMLASSPQEAVQMMNEIVKENNLTNSLKDLKQLIKEIKS